MPRWLVVTLGSAVALVTGGILGLFAAWGYERFMYVPEPDPVHFDVVAVWGGVWTFIWIGGTSGWFCWVYRVPKAKPFQFIKWP
ncbi:hypothetical protein [Planctomicrobium piriforme]|uniref:Uncharacterized protein n=1 Tax=Planctomicrobium piriforme TaxID=1576369 RepID=A0A1I3IDP7_9PLAN|nr:hypothetical protein [Planctomicrobium piriforme]SFI46071.1 hypothetical protein SAMN05421753_10978 [Planctomicrobium piriforme]